MGPGAVQRPGETGFDRPAGPGGGTGGQYGRQTEEEGIPADRPDIGQPQELTHVIVGPFGVPGPHILADDGDKGGAHRGAKEGRHRPEALGDAVGGDLDGAEHRDNRAQRHLRELEKAAFNAIGDGNPENPAEHFPVKAEKRPQPQTEDIILARGEDQHHHRRKYAGKERRVGDAGDPGMKGEDADGVADDVDRVHRDGDVEELPGLAHAPVEPGAGVVNRQRDEGAGGNPQVFHPGLVDRRFHRPEEGPEDRLPGQQGDGGQQDGDGGDAHHQLSGGGLAVFPVTAADILAGDDGAARGEGGEDEDKDVVQLVNQRDP